MIIIIIFTPPPVGMFVTWPTSYEALVGRAKVAPGA